MGCSISCPLQGGCSNPLGEEASLSFFLTLIFSLAAEGEWCCEMRGWGKRKESDLGDKMVGQSAVGFSGKDRAESDKKHSVLIVEISIVLDSLLRLFT